jgi:hypothetical protein
MKNNAVKFGIGLLAGAYIYEVSKNLYNNQSLSNALTDLDWKRVIFVGVFGGVISYFFIENNSQSFVFPLTSSNDKSKSLSVGLVLEIL